MDGERAAGGARGRFLSSASAWASILVVALGTTEVALRLLDLPFQPRWTPSENALARFDAELGWSYRPGHSAYQRFGDAGRPIPLHFDANGARVESPRAARRANLPTILLVGGSITMGHGVTYEESFAGRIGADPRLGMQVVDLAVQGYGTDQSLLRLERHIDAFDTRAVVYGFICDHVRRNANADRRLIHPGARFLGTKPRFSLASDGQLVLTDRPRRYEDLRESRIGASLRLLATRHGPEPGLALTRALVSRMRERTEAAGAHFLLLYWKEQSSEPLCGSDPFGGLGLLEVRTEDRLPPGWESWVVPGDGHPDRRAHRHVARLLADALSRLDLGSGPSAGAPPGL